MSLTHLGPRDHPSRVGLRHNEWHYRRRLRTLELRHANCFVCEARAVPAQQMTPSALVQQAVRDAIAKRDREA